MPSPSQAHEPSELGHYLKFLRSSGFSDAAAKLEIEFTAPEAECKGLSPRANQVEQATAFKDPQR